MESPEAQAGQSIFTFAGYEEVGEEVDVFEHHRFAMGNLLDPVFACGGVDGRGDEAEVAAAIVGADEPQAVAVVDCIFVLVFARADDGEFAGGLISGEDEALGGGVAGGFEHDDLPSRVRPAPMLKRSSSSW